MARAPHRRNEWLHFFFGTPGNFGRTILGVFVLLLVVKPLYAAIVLNYLLNHVILVLLPTVVMIGMIAWGFRLMFKAVQPPKKKKKSH